MKLVVSPAKTMTENTDTFLGSSTPIYLEKSRILLEYIRNMSYEEAKTMWKCSEKLASLNYDRIKNMKLQGNLTPAILSYEGIQYRYMAVNVMEESSLKYLEENLYILSGFYGILRAFDSVSPYRLEMQAELYVGGCKNLYEFWADSIYNKLFEKNETVINLASKEYSKAIEPYLAPEDRFITCIFGEKKEGKVRQKATSSKMARGEMVNFLAQTAACDAEDLKRFGRLGFHYESTLSSDSEYVFLR